MKEKKKKEKNTVSRANLPKAKKTQAEYLISDLLNLLLKIVLILTLAVLLFTFLFGIYRNASPFMTPALQDGDLILYYRLDKNYEQGDTAVMKYEGKTISLRVVAIAGDTVDIHDGGLYVNGWQQSESRITQATERYTQGVEFPLTVGPGEIFVLGDNRSNSTDSRMFGPVSITDTAGKVMAVVRCRGI